MNTYRIDAQLLAPLAVKRNRQSQRSNTARSVSGSMLRGALASLYLQQCGIADETFRRLFLDESACRFSPLDPAPNRFPCTAMSCKRQGFDHAIVDRLWIQVAQHFISGNFDEKTAAAWDRCLNCGASLKTHEGYWFANKETIREAAKNRHTVAAHVGIDRQTSTAAQAVFYTLEAIVPQQAGSDLYGRLRCDESLVAELNAILEQEDGTVSLGHHRTRGYGRVRLQLTAEEPRDTASYRKQWLTWSNELIKFLTSPPFSIEQINTECDFFFSLSLPVGAILVDPYLRYTVDPAKMIPWLAPLPNVSRLYPIHNRPSHPLPGGGTLRTITSVCQQELIRGWNAAHGLPRQDDWGVAPGATYVYWFQGTASERNALQEAMQILSEQGLGLRRNEGYGTAIISDDFHRRFPRQEKPLTEESGVSVMSTLSDQLTRQIDQYSDEQHQKTSPLGSQLFKAFGYIKKNNQISSQIRNLQQIVCSAKRFADIEDFVKNQMGKSGGPSREWRDCGSDLLLALEQLRVKAQELGSSPEEQFTIRLRLARAWVRAVVSEYLYQVALDQMEKGRA